jgi:hypothetical protein
MRKIPRLMASALLFVAAGSAVMSTACAADRSAVEQDVEGYAIASCLAAMDQPYLKDQGDGWASAIIQRSKGEPDAFVAVGKAVKAEVAKGGMAVIRNETGPQKSKPLPVMYCSEIVNAPSVHAAITKAVKKLAPSYRSE